jgi:cytochrome c553
MKKQILTFTLLLILGFSSAMAQGTTKNPGVLDQTTSKEVLSTLMISCYVCHNPRIKSHDDIIAPPLAAVKYMYKFKYPAREDFINQMTDFVLEPNNQKAIMQGPVMKFGAMPDMPLDADQVRSIVGFIYDNQIEEPVWFPDYFQQRHGMKWSGQ